MIETKSKPAAPRRQWERSDTIWLIALGTLLVAAFVLHTYQVHIMGGIEIWP